MITEYNMWAVYDIRALKCTGAVLLVKHHAAKIGTTKFRPAHHSKGVHPHNAKAIGLYIR